MLETELIDYSTVAVIIIKGRFDLGTISHVEKTFRTKLQESFPVIAFDLSQTSYIDSSGIGSLIRCINLARRAEKKCLFLDLHSDILIVFKMAKLDTFLEILSREEFQKRFIQ